MNLEIFPHRHSAGVRRAGVCLAGGTDAPLAAAGGGRLARWPGAVCCWFTRRRPPPGAWFGFDPMARAVLPMVSLLFFVCSFYAVAYLNIRGERRNRLFVFALLVCWVF